MEFPKEIVAAFPSDRHGVVVTVVGGLILAYFQLVINAQNNHPALQVDQVSLSPGDVKLFRVTPFTIDIKLLNTGTQVAAINDARLVIQQLVAIPECAAQGGYFAPTGSYRSNMPTDPRPGKVIKIPVSQLVDPGGADRFDLILQAPVTRGGLVTIYLYRVHVYLDYNVGASPVDIGEILVDLPLDPRDGLAYFWTHAFAADPGFFNYLGNFAPVLDRCLIRNSRALQSILMLPGKRTAMISEIQPCWHFAAPRDVTVRDPRVGDSRKVSDLALGPGGSCTGLLTGWSGS